MKKFFALLLCASMLLALSMPATQTTEDSKINVCGIFDDEDDLYDGEFGSSSHA